MAKKKFTDGFEDAPGEGAGAMPLAMPDSGYTSAGDVASVGLRLIAREEELRWLSEYSIAWSFRTSGQTNDEFHILSSGKVIIRGEAERSPSVRPDVDAHIWVTQRHWNSFDPQAREAWVHTLLLMIEQTAKGGLRKRRPDVVAFASVLAQYGPWADQLTLGFNAVDAFRKPQRRTDTAAGEPTPMRGRTTPADQPPITN